MRSQNRCVNPNWPFLVMSVLMAAALIVATLNLVYWVNSGGKLDPASSTSTTIVTNDPGSKGNIVYSGSGSVWSHLYHSQTGNPRAIDSGSRFKASSVNTLSIAWKTDMSSIPSKQLTSDGNYLYGCDSRGHLFKVDAKTGEEMWKLGLDTITGVELAKCGSSPLVYLNALFVGDKKSGKLFKIDKSNGQLLWKIELDSNPYASITQTPTEYKGVLYVGVNTIEPHILKLEPNYPCCSFQGSFAAIIASSGKIVWKTNLVLASGGSNLDIGGLAVVSNTPVIDVSDNTVYFTTGPIYSVSQATKDACIGSQTSCPLDELKIQGNSVVGLAMLNGALKWSAKNTLLKPEDKTSLATLYDHKRTMEYMQFVAPYAVIASDNEGNVVVFDKSKRALTYVADYCQNGLLSKELITWKSDKGKIHIASTCDKSGFLHQATTTLLSDLVDKKNGDHKFSFDSHQSTIMPIKSLARSHLIGVNDVLVHTSRLSANSSYVAINANDNGNPLFTSVMDGETKGCIYNGGNLYCTTEKEIYCYALK